MHTTSLVVEYLIIGGVGFLPFIIMLVVFFGVDIAAIGRLTKEYVFTSGILYLIFSYIIGVLFNLISRKTFKRKERRICHEVLLDEFAERLTTILKCDPAISKKYQGNTNMKLSLDDSKILLRNMRYQVHTHGGPQNSAMIEIHNHIKRISRSMVILLLLISVGTFIISVSHKMFYLGLLVSGVLLFMSLFFYFGFMQSVRSYVRSITYSFLALK